MALCPADCLDFDLIDNPTGGCPKPEFRERRISRIAFFKCDTTFPDPATAENIEPLFTGATKAVYLSSPLANVVVNDPEFEEVKIHDCVPNSRIITQRVVDFEDRVKVEFPAVEGPPAVPANPFGDYAKWQNILDHQLYLRFGFVYCNGDFVIAKDKNGGYLEAWINVFVSFQNIANDMKTIEIKKGSMAFLNDPLAMYNVPAFNLTELGISV